MFKIKEKGIIFLTTVLAAVLGMLLFSQSARADSSSSDFISQVRNTGRTTTAYTNISWTEYKPANTTITVYLRAENNATPSGSWTQVSNGGSLAAFSGQYFQYKVTLGYTDTSDTPNVQDVTINWTPNNSGTYTSGTGANALDAGSKVGGWGIFSWSQTASSGRNATGLTMQVRTSSTNAFSKGWCTVNNGDDLSVLAAGSCSASIDPHEQFIQYQTTMTAATPYLDTPYLNDVTANYYTYSASANTLTSNWFNSGNVNNAIKRLFWNSSGTGTLQFQIQSAPDLNGAPNTGAASGWCGHSDCSGTTYFTTNGDTPAAALNSVGNSSPQWFQYKVTMSSTGATNGNGTDTPVLDNLTTEYGFNNPPVVQATGAAINTGNLTVNYNLSTPTGEEASAYVRLFYQSAGVTLNTAISGTPSTVVLNNPNSLTLPTTGTVLIENEAIYYGSISNNGTTTVTLGTLSRARSFDYPSTSYPTAQVNHASTGISVYLMAPSIGGLVSNLTSTPSAQSLTWNSCGLAGNEWLKIAANDGQANNNIGSDIISLKNPVSLKNNVNLRNGVQVKN